MTLWSYFVTNPGRPIHKWTHYFPVYERHFARFVNRPCVFWEIGVGGGGSLQMWRAFLGPHARVVGLDVRPETAAFAEPGIAVEVGDQADPTFLEAVIERHGRPDVVLDDGSHRMADVAATFSHLYPRLSPEGVYMVEDAHTAYYERFGGGYRHPDSFIERSKGLVDELNAALSGGAVEPTEFSATTMSVHFYGGMVVFERGAQRFDEVAPVTGRREAQPLTRRAARKARRVFTPGSSNGAPTGAPSGAPPAKRPG